MEADSTAAVPRLNPRKDTLAYTRKDTCYKWERVRSTANAGFESRSGHHAWLGADGRSVYVFGGCGKARGSSRNLEHCRSGLSKFDAISQTWQSLRFVDQDEKPITTVLDGSAAALDPHSGSMYVFGGRRRVVKADAFVQGDFSNSLDVVVRRRPTRIAAAPAPATNATSTSAAAGAAATTNATAAIATNGTASANSTSTAAAAAAARATTEDISFTMQRVDVDGAAPPALQDAALVHTGRGLLVFGGFSDQGLFNDIYTIAFSGPKALSWVKVNATLAPGLAQGPAPRRGHTLTRINPGAGAVPTDASADFLLVGGTDGVTTFADTWVLSIKGDSYTWSQKQVTTASATVNPLTARAFHTVSVIGNRAFVQGGCSTTSTPAVCFDDIGILNLEKWTWEAPPLSLQESSIPFGTSPDLHAPRSPSARRGSTAVVLDKVGKIVYIGGCTLEECPGEVVAVHARGASTDVSSGTGVPKTKVFAGNVFVFNSDALCAGSCVSGKYVEETPHDADAPVTDDNYIGAHCACNDFGHGKFCQNTYECPRGCSVDKGECIKERGVAFCRCKPGFWGRDCATAVCRNNCNGRGVCTVGPNPNIVSKTSRANADRILDLLMGLSDQAKAVAKDIWFRSQSHCVCRDGYFGRDCGLETEPLGNDEYRCPKHCSGHGLCTPGGKCQCQAGFAGADCSVQCPSACSGNGVCSNDGVCKCKEGFTGPDCSVRKCLNDCSKNGVCQDGVCKCVNGYGGVFCQLSTSCSGHGAFKDGKCVCDAGFGGPNCSRIVKCENGCSDNGRCVEPFPSVDETHLLSKPIAIGSSLIEMELDDSGKPKAPEALLEPTPDRTPLPPLKGMCQCAKGWRGPNCNLRACKQKCRNGFCNEDGSCVCFPGWRGETCTISAPCPHNCTAVDHGTCTPSGSCKCINGWHGPDCGEPGCPKDCSEQGQCRKGRCYCKKGFSGLDCSTQCKNRCNKRGDCIDGKCKCYPGFEGDDCSKLTQCPRSITTKVDCSGHGFCFRARKKCFCEPGWSGEDCSEQVGNCEAHQCTGHGTCKFGKCFCDVGFSGDKCEIVNKCPGNCNGKGYCLHGRCYCYNGFEGAACERFTKDKTCPSKCSGNGFCMHGRCFCADGYGGADCSEPTGFCKDNTCSNNGVCKFGKCFCQPGSSGARCEQGGCNPKCEEGKGVCILGSCRCNPGFSGPACSTPLTCPQGCSDKGVCILGSCACLPGFTGRDCSVAVILAGNTTVTVSITAPAGNATASACPANCSNRGVCRNGKCICAPGFDGLDCSIEQEASCPMNCNGEPPLFNQRGFCRYGKCFCKPGYGGVACEKELSCSSDCYKNGVCHFGKCHCLPGFGGNDCATRVDAADAIKAVNDANPKPPLNSNLTLAANATKTNGTAVNGTAAGNTTAGANSTRPNFLDTTTTVPPKVDASSVFAVVASTMTGSNATAALPDALSSMHKPCGELTHGCSQHGLCVKSKCACEPGYAGVDCSIVLGGQLWHRCPSACNKRGLCLFGKCYCDLGFGGPACQDDLSVPCPGSGNCNGNGICSHSRCYCLPGFEGDACEHKVNCNVDCGAHGVCFRGQCVCAKGFGGDFCQYPARAAGARPGIPGNTIQNDFSVFRFKEAAGVTDAEHELEQQQEELSVTSSSSSTVTESGEVSASPTFVEMTAAASPVHVNPAIVLAVDEALLTCDGGCNHGRCVGGKCYCEPGYGGLQCRTVVDPDSLAAPPSRLSVVLSSLSLKPLGADWNVSPIVLVFICMFLGAFAGAFLRQASAPVAVKGDGRTHAMVRM